MLDFEGIEDEYLEVEAEEIVVGTCEGCHEDVVVGEEVIMYDSMMCHDDSECIRNMLLDTCGASEEFARKDLV